MDFRADFFLSRDGTKIIISKNMAPERFRIPLLPRLASTGRHFAMAADRQQLRYEIDLNGWMSRIWMVAASGFLTDSYNLFASNVILATLQFVYEPYSKWTGTIINVFTLLGSVCGQLSFGYLADRYGRTKLYGIELVLVIVSTIGVATSSHGYGDLSFLALFTWWRFVMGVGIGAEYPLSAVITAEWSSTASRATMISSVFLMQPVGQALAQIVGVWVLLGQDAQKGLQEKQCGLNTLYNEECKRIVDGIWRIVIGSGAVPALLAIIFRFFLYDCGLYSLEVRNKPGTAFRDTQRIYGPPPTHNGVPLGSPSGVSMPSPQAMPVQFSLEDLKRYFIMDKNWYYLVGTAATWFFLDVSFYGFSLDNRGTLSDLWATTGPAKIGPNLSCWNSTLPGGNSTLPMWQAKGIPNWQTDLTQPCNNIYDTLLGQAKQYLLTVSIASIAGSACFIFAANKFPRRQWLIISFLLLAVLFVITGGVYYAVAHTRGAPVTVVLVAICHFVFNFGANTLTFIIPAELFPTCYRCTCHGISAAAGKIGSIMAILVFYGINTSYNNSKKQGLIFLLFGSFMALGALYAWAYLPDVQRYSVEEWVEGDGANAEVCQIRRLENKTLEELGEGRERARQEGQAITIREKWGEIKRRGTRRLSSIASGGGA